MRPRSRRKRGVRGATFETPGGTVVVRVARDEKGEACGSEITYSGSGRRWVTAAWPDRVVEARPLGDGVALTLRGGASKLLGIEDAEPEAAA